MKKSQREEVLNRLMKRGSITSMEAFERYGITRLSSIIYLLRKEGYNIATINQTITNRYGHRCDYAQYKLIKKD